MQSLETFPLLDDDTSLQFNAQGELRHLLTLKGLDRRLLTELLDEAQQFVQFSMDEGYTSTLSIAPEGKFPVRRGTADNATAFVDAWSKLDVGVDRKAPLSSLYDAAMIQEIVGGLDVAQRWGVSEGQLALASKIINSQAINRVVREYIDGNIEAAAAVAKMNEELAGIQ